MTVNEAMLQVAKDFAKNNGYIEVSNHVIDAKTDSFWGNKVLGYESKTPILVNACKYIIPVWEDDLEQITTPKIYINMYWGKPRLFIGTPNKDAACITYKDNVCYEAQAFGKNGIELALKLKTEIDNLLAGI